MPAKNRVKFFAEDSFYHAYNRGVEKRNIFLDDSDYAVFLHLLKIYLSPANTPQLTRSNLVRPRPIQDVADEIKLIAFCLMPNHFHLLLKQRSREGMTRLVRKVSTTYAMYFNERYKRVGSLFQGTYRAVLVNSENYLLHLSRYIHLNSLELTGSNPVSYPYSSYPYYLGKKHAAWVDPKPILSYFHAAAKNKALEGVSSYQDFVEAYQEDPAEVLGSLTLD